MRVSRFHEEQIVRLLREQELSGLTETEAIRLKRLERENARLKGLLADRELELEVLKEINAKKWSA